MNTLERDSLNFTSSWSCKRKNRRGQGWTGRGQGEAGIGQGETGGQADENKEEHYMKRD